MASAKKVTYTLDDGTVQRIERVAQRLGVPRSQVVREAVAEYAARADRLGDAERRRMLATLDEVIPKLPVRRPARVARELDEIRVARRSGGRRSGGERR